MTTFLLSMLLGAGFGSIARFQTLRGVFWTLVELVCFGGMILVAAMDAPELSAAFLGLLVLVRVLAGRDAVRTSGNMPFRWNAVVGAWLSLSVVVATATHVVKTFVIEAFRIPSQSMAPTLVTGDHIYASKRDFVPKRGDVIVFRFPRDPEKDYIKRVVALGGDTVEFRGGALYVNDKAISRTRIDGDCLETSAATEAPESCEMWTESIDGRSWPTWVGPATAASNTPPLKVPPDSLFVVGDNRDKSFDSRVWGPLTRDHVKGKALFIWYSSSPNGYHWERIFQHIE